jgi:hypothetical protein
MSRPAVVVALALLASPVAAQVTVLDEGSFTITRDGRTIGREDFRISRTPGVNGDAVVAQATVSYGAERRLIPALQAEGGSPVRYVVEVRGGGETLEKLSGTIGRGRFSARIQTARGESVKEFLVADGAYVLDDEVFHQHYFLGRAAPGRVAVVVPRRNAQVVMTLVAGPDESVTVGGQQVPARRLALSEPGGAERTMWVDGRGRVLRVAIPARGIIAQRDEAPR